MEGSQPESPGGALRKRRKESSGGGDRLSKLEDRVLGNILSFLPAKEAARGALLSSRWRDVFAAVHTVSLREPESPIPDYDRRGYCGSPPPEHRAPPPFSSSVSAALLARNRRCGAAPLRALRVAMERYGVADSFTVDQWVSYAVQQSAPEGLELDLRLWCRFQLCPRPYALRRGQQQDQKQPDDTWTPMQMPAVFDAMPESSKAANSPRRRRSMVGAVSESDDDSSVLSSSDDDDDHKHSAQWDLHLPVYTITTVIFSCAELRALSLSSCRLAPPTTVSLPSLVTLLLSHVLDPGSDVERLIAGCPRLADLTLEACGAVTTLSVLGGARLRRLALRCCHELAAVAIDASELQAFEYRGAVADGSFLTMHGGSGRVAYLKVDVCGAEVASEEELLNLRKFLQLFVNIKHLHLESARLGSGLDMDVPLRFPTFTSLRHLEVRGRLPDDDDDAAAIGAVSRILEHAPNLEVLSLAFHPEEHDLLRGPDAYYSALKEELLLDAHHLSYNPHSVLAVPSSMIPCLRSRVREINLVHYQGGRAQRTLAKFLLCNAPAMEELWCDFAEGPLWTQTQLMREIRGWVINESANAHFA